MSEIMVSKALLEEIAAALPAGSELAGKVQAEIERLSEIEEAYWLWCEEQEREATAEPADVAVEELPF